MAVLFAGDISWDMSLVMPAIPAPDQKVHCSVMTESTGGVIANAAVAHARAGRETRLAVQTGKDLASQTVLEHVAGQGIAITANQVDGKLCRVVTMLEPHGEKRLLLYPGVSLVPDPAFLCGIALDGVDHVHTVCYGSGWYQLIAKCRRAGVSWSIDLEPASFSEGLDTVADAIAGARVIFCNDRAAQIIGQDAVEVLFARGAQSVLRTRGAEGASLYLPGMAPINKLPAKSNTVVDTTGAGDCLAGWYLAEMIAGTSPETALARAVLAATLSCSSIGAQTGYPNRTDILKHEHQEAK